MARFESLTADWLPLDEALERTLSRAAPLPPERIPLRDALHRVLSGEVRARVTLPPADNSAMDGYAVRGEDIAAATEADPVALEVVGAVLAGNEPGPPVGPGEAVRIMTGAPVPPGADGVVRVEDTDAEEEEPGVVRVRSSRDRGRNVRPGGRDFSEGDPVAERGTIVTPGWTAVIAGAGWAEVDVHRRPRVAILSCGDELRPPGDVEDVRRGIAVPESNGIMLQAAVRSAGAEPVDAGIARDEPGDLRTRIAEVADADVLVTIGGASMGEADLLKRTLLDDGLELDFWRTRIRPGSPVSLGRLPREGRPSLPVFGLPGNPASAFVTFQILVRPFLRTLAGDPRPHRPVVRAEALEEMRSGPRLCHLHRVALEGPADAPRARRTGPQGSGLVSSLGPADGLAIVPEGIERIDAGGTVEVILLADGPRGSAERAYRCRMETG